MSSLPTDAAFYPPVPSGTIVPSRGFGIDAGGHVYLMSLGPARLGLGAGVLRARGTADSVPKVTTRVTAVAPQISANFGSAQGWSYLSAGYGWARVDSSATPGTTRHGDVASSANVGFGARWFTSRHVAFSFDLRFHMASTSPKTTLTVGSVGMSLK
jgi:hypothetical protein